MSRKHAPRLSSVARQLVAVRIIESATALAARSFMTLGQVLLVVAAFSPEGMRRQIQSSMRSIFGLHGAALQEMEQLLAPGHSDALTGWGVVSIVLLLVSSTSLSRAFQRRCEQCWHVPHAGPRDAAWRWLPWFFVLVIVLVAEATIQNGFGAGPAAAIPLSLTSGTLLWWWTQHLLLGGRVRWLPLLPGAVLAAAGAVAVFWGSRLYMPSALNRSIAQFGLLGTVFAILNWLIIFCGAILAGLAIGYAVAGWQPFARWLGTPVDHPAERPV